MGGIWPENLPLRWAIASRWLRAGALPSPAEVKAAAEEIEDKPSAWDRYGPNADLWAMSPRQRGPRRRPVPGEPPRELHDPRGMAPATVIRGHKQRTVSRYRARVHLQLTPLGIRGWLMAALHWPAVRRPGVWPYWSDTQINRAHAQRIISRHEARMLLQESGEGWGPWLVDRPLGSYVRAGVALALVLIVITTCIVRA